MSTATWRTRRCPGRTGVLALLACGALYFAVTGSAQAASGTWDRAWGKDVVATGGVDFEICTVAADCKAGSVGGLGGELNGPAGAGTDAAGNVYVADTFNHRIEKFDSSGSFLRAWGKDVVSAGPGNTGTGFEICVAANGDTCQAGTGGGLGGELNGPNGVATDAAGNVYVADLTNQRIDKFDSSGNFLRAWGRDVVSAGPGDTGTGSEICVAANGDTCKAGPAAGLGGEFNGPSGVATDAAGNVYVADASNNRIQKFDSSSSFLRAWGKDVASAGPGDTGTGFEVCVAANGDTCKAGTTGGLGGEFNNPAGLATDASGNVYVADFASNRIQKFADAPTARPTFTSTNPASPANDNAPKILGSAESGSTVRLYTNASCSGSPVASGSAATFASPGIVVSVADNSTTTFYATATNAEGNTSACSTDSTTTFRATATDAAGNASPCSAAFTYVEDSTAPDTTIDSGPSGATNDSTPTFAFSSGESSASFECKLDGGSFASCSSPSTTGALTDGAHTFSVRATDQIGNTDASPASRTFTVDTQAPQTKLLKHPPKETTSRTATFKFKSSEPGSTFKCKLDRKPVKPCTSPKRYRRLKPGKHVFKVRATDSAGNADRTAAKWSWTIKA